MESPASLTRKAGLITPSCSVDAAVAQSNVQVECKEQSKDGNNVIE